MLSSNVMCRIDRYTTSTNANAVSGVSQQQSGNAAPTTLPPSQASSKLSSSSLNSQLHDNNITPDDNFSQPTITSRQQQQQQTTSPKQTHNIQKDARSTSDRSTTASGTDDVNYKTPSQNLARHATTPLPIPLHLLNNHQQQQRHQEQHQHEQQPHLQLDGSAPKMFPGALSRSRTGTGDGG